MFGRPQNKKKNKRILRNIENAEKYPDIKSDLIALIQKLPVGLLNIGENVCFFNAAIQVLNSIPSFWNYVHDFNTSDLAIKAMTHLSQNSSVPVRTAKYLQVPITYLVNNTMLMSA